MTWRDPPPEVPPCPICETVGTLNRAAPSMGRYECSTCVPVVFYDGSTGEWERRAPARQHRKAVG